MKGKPSTNANKRQRIDYSQSSPHGTTGSLQGSQGYIDDMVTWQYCGFPSEQNLYKQSIQAATLFAKPRKQTLSSAFQISSHQHHFQHRCISLSVNMCHFSRLAVVAVYVTVLVLRVTGQACEVNPVPRNGINPIAAPGYHWSVVANGLTKPRSIQFDNAGNLLVLQAGKGIESLQLADAGGACVWAASSETVVSHTAVSSLFDPKSVA